MSASRAFRLASRAAALAAAAASRATLPASRAASRADSAAALASALASFWARTSCRTTSVAAARALGGSGRNATSVAASRAPPSTKRRRAGGRRRFMKSPQSAVVGGWMRAKPLLDSRRPANGAGNGTRFIGCPMLLSAPPKHRGKHGPKDRVLRSRNARYQVRAPHRRFRWPPITSGAFALRPPSARCAASKPGRSAGWPAR